MIDLPLAEETADWAEQPVYEKPQRAFVSVIGNETGLTIANRGLPEVAVHPAGDNGIEIALTLLRCVGWLSRDDLSCRQGPAGPQIPTPAAQCHGEHHFVYSVIPHGKDPLPAWQAAWATQTDLQARTTGIHRGPLPPTGSLVYADNPQFVVSAVKAPEHGSGLIIRGYSLSDEPEEVTLHPGYPFDQGEIVRLDETPVGVAIHPDQDGCFTTSVQPAQILTVRLFNDQ